MFRKNHTPLTLLRSLVLLSVPLLTCIVMAEDKPAPAAQPDIFIGVEPGDTYKVRAKTVFTPTKADGEKVECELVVTGNVDDPVEFKIVVRAAKKPKPVDSTLHVEGVVKDFFGAEVPESKVSLDIKVKSGETKTEVVVAKPAKLNVGPFTFAGIWKQESTELKGDLLMTIAQANSRSRLDDFEEPKFNAEKDALEYTFSAQYNIGWQGRNGLSIHLPKVADAGGKSATKALSYNVKLPGRPVKLGFWVKPAGNIQVYAHLLDSNRPKAGNWTIGPIALKQSDWHFAEIPIYLPLNAKEDYRLTLQQIVFEGPPSTGVLIDDLDVFSQRDILASLAPGDGHKAVPFSYTGTKIHPNGIMEGINVRPGLSHVSGSCPAPVELTLSASAFGKDRAVHVSATVTDFNGLALPQINMDVPVKAGESIDKAIQIATTEKHTGPFYIKGTWTEANSANTDIFSEIVGSANWHSVIEDFEEVKYSIPGGALENSSSAKHSGEMGLIVRPQLPQAPSAGQLPIATANIPIGAALPGRPVKIGMWLKSTQPVQVRMQLRDPGVNHQGAMRYDTWNVGPVEAAAGDWHYVELPMPGYGAPKGQTKSYTESNGVIDYPLTLESISISGEPKSEVMVDDVAVWSQSDQADSILLKAYSSKPSGLLYRNDEVCISVSNAWLWGKPLAIGYRAKLSDLFGKQYPLVQDGIATVPPGGAHIERIKVKDLPLGPYSLLSEAKIDGKIMATIPPPKTVDNPHPEQNFLVYEPTGKPLDFIGLNKLLGDRNQLIAELGFSSTNMQFTWHSTQNSPAIESYPGYFYFDWLAPEVKMRKEAGLEIVGTLGFTPQFYDPSARFITVYSEWFGDVTAMPSRSMYFEEYVHRTIKHFAGQVNTWVVWDRPDLKSFATPAEYTDNMLEVARRAADEANPNAKLISGAITQDNIQGYLEGIIEAGGHNYVDGIGILPSPAPLSPEDGNLDIILARAQRLRKQEHVKPELWVLNLAWNTGDAQGTVSELDQAIYIPRAWIMCQAQGIQHIMVQPDGTQPIAAKNSADLIFPNEGGYTIKPAAVSTKTVSALLKGVTIVREVFLNDRSDDLTRSYVFKRPDGKLLLAAWRRSGSSILPFLTKPEMIIDSFGNTLPIESSPQLTLRPAPQYVVFFNIDANTLIKQLERSVLVYEDAAESAWKNQFTFHLDVGDPEDEKAAGYSVTDGRLVGPIESSYFSEYGRHVVDSGRHFKGQERFTVDVSAFDKADLMLRKRINYSVRNQLVKVYCNEQVVGQWCAPLADRRFRWRDIEYIIPNSFFNGKKTAALRFEAMDGEASSYYYWAGPLRNKKLFASDLSLLCGTAGPAGPFVNRDKNIIGSAMTFPKSGDAYPKGIGTNAGTKDAASLVVLCLNKQYKTLHAVIGIDTCTNGRGSAVFSVSGLNKKIFKSKRMNGYDAPQIIDIDVSDQIAVMLSVNNPDDGKDDDIANWADLRLELK